MAKVYGELREGESTYGERVVLSLLKKNLPNDFTVYVECPLVDQRKNLHPDFIVLTNYGVVVLEVKDWKEFYSSDAYSATILTSNHEKKKFPNPVETSRSYAISLINKFKSHKQKYNQRIDASIPYGFAAIFPHATLAIKTRLQKAWGENFVFNLKDLDSMYIKIRLRETISKDHIRQITKEQMDLARGVINPEVTYENFILDDKQEEIVMEQVPRSWRLPHTSSKSKSAQIKSEQLFESDVTNGIEEFIPEENLNLARSSYRLIRGSMGSGKTSVLRARARHLAKNHPEWQILVLSFNKAVALEARKFFHSFMNVESTNLHELISEVLRKRNKYEWRQIINQESWIKNQLENEAIIQELGVEFVYQEIKWIQETMIRSRQQYLKIRRVGRGSFRLLNQDKRESIYNLYEKLNTFLELKRQFTYETMVLFFLDKLEKKEIEYKQYDAILIDEAQDFAPSWMAIINHLLRDGGTLFLVDDPKQSIFRFFSWKQKGVLVSGRTKHLKRPYRNTRQIYAAAEALLKGDVVTINRLKADGDLQEPDDDLEFMIEGEKPSLINFQNLQSEFDFIENRIKYLRQKKNIAYNEMAILHLDSRQLKKYQEKFSHYGLQFYTCRKVKGLEFKSLFLCGLDYFFRDSVVDAAEVSHQKSLIYMSMGRARKYLIMTCQGELPQPLNTLSEFVDRWKI